MRRPYQSSPCHLLTSATLKALGAVYPTGQFVSRRFRPNVMLDCGDEAGFIETGWMNRALAIGPVAMTVTEHCLRCALTTRAAPALMHGPGNQTRINPAQHPFQSPT